jgi:hypothetical protein
MGSAGIEEIVNFWFGELSPKDWFRKDEALDSTIASRFGTTYHELRSGVPDPGSTRRKASSRRSSCLISFRATCSGRTRAASPPTLSHLR